MNINFFITPLTYQIVLKDKKFVNVIKEHRAYVASVPVKRHFPHFVSAKIELKAKC